VQQLYEFEKQVKTQGSRNDKLKEIWTYTFQEFMSAKDKNLIIHDYDLKRWALYKEERMVWKTLQHPMIGCGDLKAKIVSFQEKLHDLSQAVILEKRLI